MARKNRPGDGVGEGQMIYGSPKAPQESDVPQVHPATRDWGISFAAARQPGGMPPCFYFKSCRRRAQIEKHGKSLCRQCAERLKGREYPLRKPSYRPLYINDKEIQEALSMVAPPCRIKLKRRKDEKLSSQG